MQLVLGVDGGGTGCRAAVATLSGQVLGRGEAGPANIASALDQSARNLRDAIGKALSQAGGVERDIRSAVFGLAGANMPGTPERLAKLLPFPQTRIVTDAVTATRGALGETDGIVAAIGTGSVFARQVGGEIRQFGGYGLVLGDEGSGASLGRALLRRAVKAHDGIVPMTPLLAEVLERMGGPGGMVGFATTARPADFATLAPEVTASRDPAAQAILADAVAEVETMLATVCAGTDLPVVFIGGLGRVYADRLQARFPIRPAQGSGLDGAVMMARGML